MPCDSMLVYKNNRHMRPIDASAGDAMTHKINSRTWGSFTADNRRCSISVDYILLHQNSKEGFSRIHKYHELLL